MERMSAAVLTLDRAGWPPIYAFVYDEFWGLTRGRRFRQLLEQLLGPSYRQKVATWVHLLEPKQDRHGWAPHIDLAPDEGCALNPDGSLRYLSVWIPLTDATPDNGCMYLVPRDRLAGVLAPGRPDQAPVPDLFKSLHSVRALPLAAGSLAGWAQDLLHWGSYCSGLPSPPRLSVAFEFQSEGGNPRYRLLRDGHWPASLEERLLYISHQILRYLREWEPHRAAGAQLELAEQLRARLESHGAGWIAS
jgi:hypothetical protein